jgi:GT2 family glycosyltransferase
MSARRVIRFLPHREPPDRVKRRRAARLGRHSETDVEARLESSDRLTPLPLGALAPDPSVSVLVANYNYAHFVATALDSVLGQSYERFEVIVCDDGSSDGSVEIVRGYEARDPRVKLIVKDNGGVASALNRAFESSAGDVLCLLDADDLFHPSKLRAVVEAFASNDWGLLVHPMMVVDESGAEVQRKPAFSTFEAGWLGERNLARGGRWMYMEASAVCMRREIAERAFPISEDDFRSWADAYLCTLAALLAPVGFVDEPLAFYRLHSSNTSGFDALSKEQALKGIDGVRRVVEGVNTRLRDLGLGWVQLDPQRHLTFVESALQADLFGGEVGRVELLRRYRRYLAAMSSDGLYSPARRALASFFLGSAILLPGSRRAGWVSAGMTESRIKERVRSLLSKLPRPGSA